MADTKDYKKFLTSKLESIEGKITDIRNRLEEVEEPKRVSRLQDELDVKITV